MSSTRKILLIDDEQIMHDLAHAYLERDGYELLSAYTGPTGLESVRSLKPDVVLLDYKMPGLNGEQVFKRLREYPEYADCRDVPVIFLTAKGGDDDLKHRLIKNGVMACLKKPFGLRELSNLLENIFIIADIRSENLKLQKELSASKEYLERVISTAPVGIMTTDEEGFLVEANPRFRKLFGSSEWPSRVANHPDWQLFEAGIRAVLERGETWETRRHRWTLPDGEQIVLSARFVAMTGKEPEAGRGVIGIFEDITERERFYSERDVLARISAAMQAAFEFDELVHLILTGITAGQALGFTRAMLFLVDPDSSQFRGWMGVGPASRAHAHEIWEALEAEDLSLESFLKKYGRRIPAPDDKFNALVRRTHIGFHETCPLVSSILSHRSYRFDQDTRADRAASPTAARLALHDYIAVPLVANNRLLGMIIADNKYVRRGVDAGQQAMLLVLAGQAANVLERARAYQMLARRQDKLEQAYDSLRITQERLIQSERLAAIGELAAHVAHEIRNPLVTIGGFARQLVRGARRTGDKNAQAEIIANEVLRLEKILANVLNFTKLPNPKPARNDLNQVVAELCAQLAPEFCENNIRLHQDLHPELPRFFFDKDQIKQVLLNLLRNSEQSINTSGAITIVTRRGEKDAELTISDDGDGIPREIQNVIFNPFYTTKSRGTGLGLAISQRVVSEHGGMLKLISRRGVGTRIRIRLPLRQRARMAGHGPGERVRRNRRGRIHERHPQDTAR